MQVDTSNILFIVGGAFAGLDKVIAGRMRKTGIGFKAEVKEKDEKGVGELFQMAEPEDLVRFGLIPEFVGRVPVLASLEDLDEDALVTILTDPKNALIKQYQELFAMENVNLSFTDGALKAVAAQAIERKTGARGLRAILEGILLDTMFDLPNEETLEEVVINKDVAVKKTEPLRIYSKDSKKSDVSA